MRNVYIYCYPLLRLMPRICRYSRISEHSQALQDITARPTEITLLYASCCAELLLRTAANKTRACVSTSLEAGPSAGIGCISTFAADGCDHLMTSVC